MTKLVITFEKGDELTYCIDKILSERSISLSLGSIDDATGITYRAGKLADFMVKDNKIKLVIKAEDGHFDGLERMYVVFEYEKNIAKVAFKYYE